MKGEGERERKKGKKVTVNAILPEIKDDAVVNSTIDFILPLHCYFCNALLARIFISNFHYRRKKSRQHPLSFNGVCMC